MKIYTLLMVMLVVLAGCSTTYKGSIKGANNQQETKTGSTLVLNATGSNPSGIDVSR